jgi:hypothetical protein
MTFDELVKEMRTVAGPGRLTTVSYTGLKFALECGIDIISDYAEMYTLSSRHSRLWNSSTETAAQRGADRRTVERRHLARTYRGRDN